MKPLNGLRLILGILRTQAVYRCVQGSELAVVIPVGTGLRRTTACPGDRVPRCRSAQRLLIRSPGSWVAVDDEPRSTFLGQIDRRPGSRPQANRREHRPTKAITRSVVLRDGQVLGERIEIVSSHRWLRTQVLRFMFPSSRDEDGSSSTLSLDPGQVNEFIEPRPGKPRDSAARAYASKKSPPRCSPGATEVVDYTRRLGVTQVVLPSACSARMSAIARLRGVGTPFCRPSSTTPPASQRTSNGLPRSRS